MPVRTVKLGKERIPLAFLRMVRKGRTQCFLLLMLEFLGASLGCVVYGLGTIIDQTDELDIRRPREEDKNGY